MCPKTKPIRNLQCGNEEFDLLLKNRFELLYELDDIDEMAEEMAKGIKQVAEKVKGPPRTKPQKISEATKNLLQKEER